jgi:hypothetical protein
VTLDGVEVESAVASGVARFTLQAASNIPVSFRIAQ